jgi:aspartyl-tRNA synthetase
MAIHEHYNEVLDVIEAIFMDMFKGLETQYARELEVVAQQYPFEPIAYKPLRLTFAEGIKMLQENGYPDVSACTRTCTRTRTPAPAPAPAP